MSSTTTDGGDAVTFINVIEIAPDQVDRFVAGWLDRAAFMSTRPGFRDYRLHRAVADDTRFRLVAVAQWDNRDAYEAAIADPDFLARRQAAMDSNLDVTANPGLYRVVGRKAAEIG